MKRKILKNQEKPSLRSIAGKNSVEKYGITMGHVRMRLAQIIRGAREKDRRLTSGPRWEVSFNAGLSEFNQFYRTDLANFLRLELGNRSRLNVLEIGCGTGRAAREIVSKVPGLNYTATGVALVPEWKMVTKKVKYKVMQALQLNEKFKPNSMDFIHSNLGISYNEEWDITRVLEQCRTVLRKGGKLLFTCERIPKIPAGFKLLSYSPSQLGNGRGFMQEVYLLQKE